MKRRRPVRQILGQFRMWITALVVVAMTLTSIGAVAASSVSSAPPAGAATSAVTCVGSNLSSTPGNSTPSQQWNSSTLAVGQALCNGNYALVMQSDGNLVLYDQSQATPVWASDTAGHSGDVAVLSGTQLCVAGWCTPAYYGTGLSFTTTLQLASSGNLSIAEGPYGTTWQTGTDGSNWSQLLESGQSLSSPDGQYQLDMQTDGNLVLYYEPSASALWQSNTAGNPGAGAVMQADGNLVVYSEQHAALYDTGSTAANPTLAVQDDGNMVIYGMSQGTQTAVWSSNTAGSRGTTLQAGQTLQPGQYLQNGGYTLQLSTAGVLALYSTQPYDCPLWTAPTIAGGSSYSAAPQSGSYFVVDKTGGLDLDSPGTTSVWWTASQTSTWTGGSATPSDDHLILQPDGNLVLYSATGQTLWSSNTENLRGSILCTGTDLQINQYLVPWTAGSSPAPQYGDALIMQGDCNLVLYSAPGVAPWASGTSESTSSVEYPGTVSGNSYDGCYATMQTDGNLAVYAPNYPGGQKLLWQSGTNQASQLPFNLGAIGPYLTIPIVGGSTQAPFVTTAHGTTLGDPLPPSKSKVLQILGYVFDALSLVLTFVAGPLGDVFGISNAASDVLAGVGIAGDAGATAVAGVGAARGNAVGGQAQPSVDTPSTCDGGLPSSGSALPTGLLTAGQCLISPNGQYELIMQNDGNLVLYDQSQSDPIWSSDTAGNPGAFMRLQANGYLAVLNSNNTVQLFYAPNSQGTPNPTLVLQNDGNLVLYGSAGVGTGVHAVWDTGVATTVLSSCSQAAPATAGQGTLITAGGCLLSPNGQYELIMQNDGNLVLYYQSQSDPIWDSNTAGNPGAFLRIQSNGFTGVLNSTNTATLYVVPKSVVTADPTLTLGNNGNLVLYGNNSMPSATVAPYAIWQTGTANLRGASLPSGATLTPGQYLSSPNGTYKLSMGTNGLLELSYLTAPASQAGSYFCPMWSRPYSTSQLGDLTDGNPEMYSPSLSAGSSLVMQSDGNLVVDSGSGVPSGYPIDVSSTEPNLGNNAGAYLQVQDDGNVVVYASNGSALWSSGTNDDRGPALCTGASLTPGQYLTEIGYPNRTTENTLELTSNCQLVYYGSAGPEWNTSGGVAADGSNAADYAGCSAVMQGDGNLVIYAPNDPTNDVVWASNTHQSSSPPNLVQNLGPYSLVNPGDVPDASEVPGVQVITDSGVVLWQDPVDSDLEAAADGSTAVSAVQTLVGVLTLLLPLLL